MSEKSVIEFASQTLGKRIFNPTIESWWTDMGQSGSFMAMLQYQQNIMLRASVFAYLNNHKAFVKSLTHRSRLAPALLAKIKVNAKRPLKDAAAVNSTRWALFNALKALGLPVETGSGGKTKWNRSRLDVPKTHALDAACVGNIESLTDWEVPSLSIKATGRGAYSRTRLDKYGFPRGYLTRDKRIHGFQTGDMVKAVLDTGVHAGTWVGRVAVRASGSFNIQTVNGVRQGIGYKHCQVIQRADGYGYSTTQTKKGAGSSPYLKVGVSPVGI
jgi:hypothetical protein